MPGVLCAHPWYGKVPVQARVPLSNLEVLLQFSTQDRLDADDVHNGVDINSDDMPNGRDVETFRVAPHIARTTNLNQPATLFALSWT